MLPYRFVLVKNFFKFFFKLFLMERVMGIEPTYLAWKARALPLSYTRISWSWREESNPQPADYKSAALPIELHQRFSLSFVSTVLTGNNVIIR